MSRALALADAFAAGGLEPELELVSGRLAGGEAREAAGVGLTVLPAGSPIEAGQVVLVDVPEINATAARFDPERLVVMDDRDVFRGSAAIVVQPSAPAWTGSGAAGRVLAGYQYVPLRRRFRALRGSAGHQGGPVRVVVCFGGSDPDRVTERLASALAGGGWETDLIVGAGYDGPTAGWPIEPNRAPDDLPERLAAADIAVVGAGTMKFEVACLGRPAILLAVADDQLAVGPPFARTGAAIYLGDGRTIEPGLVRQAVDDLLADREAMTAMVARAREVVDGRGAERLVDAIASLEQ